MQLIVKLSTLLDDIKSDFQYDYDKYIGDIKKKLETYNEDLKHINKRIVKNKNAVRKHESERTALRDKIKSLPELPPADDGTIEKREHMRYLCWKWALEHKPDSLTTERIIAKLTERYQRKSEDSKQGISFDEYKDLFCMSIAKAHEDASPRIARGFVKISAEQGQEIDTLHIYGDERDEFLTVFINAVGLRRPPKYGEPWYKMRKIAKP